MARYELTFEGYSYFADCNSMEEAEKKTVSMIDDSDMDWVEERRNRIVYYDYFVNVLFAKLTTGTDPSAGNAERKGKKHHTKCARKR